MFVLVKFRDYEGHSAPRMLFSTKEEAMPVWDMMQQEGDGQWRLYEVPRWPETNPTTEIKWEQS